MTVIRDLNSITKKFPHPVITIGNFDGVHLGHQALFDLVKEKAGKAGGTSMVLTFEPHPLRALKKHTEMPLITLYEQKKELIEAQGIDVLICLDFNQELAEVEPEDFVKNILVEKIGVKEIVIGYDFRFGAKGRGDKNLLIELGKELGFSVDCVGPKHGDGDEIISSTRVRDIIIAGDVSKAPDLLGRNYRISGQVVRGKNRGGSLLGFPTANLRLVDELIPSIGVYAVRVTYCDKIYGGVANIGYNPTFGDVGLSVEVHCFDFDEDIYDQFIKVDFVAAIRDEKKFSGIDELKGQIQKDCDLAIKLLAE